MTGVYSNWARNSLNVRLQYIRQMYTCLFVASQSGESCFDPLFFHFPTIDDTYKDIEHSFIFANALKITPVLEANATTIDTYFPNGNWVDMNKMDQIERIDDPSGGKMITLKAPNGMFSGADATINIHLLPGSLIILQKNNKGGLTTYDMIQKGEINLVINRD